MGLFDSIKNAAASAANKAPVPGGNKTEEVVFAALPDNLEQFQSLPQASLANPFDTAALTVLALCFYPQDKDASLAMLDFLRGPRPLSTYDKQFIREPYTVKVSENPYSYQNEGYAKLFVTSGGADSPREITLRLAKDGKWYLWEQFILAGIREPESSNPWA